MLKMDKGVKSWVINETGLTGFPLEVIEGKEVVARVGVVGGVENARMIEAAPTMLHILDKILAAHSEEEMKEAFYDARFITKYIRSMIESDLEEKGA